MGDNGCIKNKDESAYLNQCHPYEYVSGSEGKNPISLQHNEILHYNKIVVNK